LILDDLRSKTFEYQKAGDKLRLDVLRYYLSQVKNREIELRSQQKEMTDEDAFKVLRKEVKTERKV